MTVFMRHLDSCRESHYKPTWEAKSGNIVTRSVISPEQAIRLHGKKLEKIGRQIKQIVWR